MAGFTIRGNPMPDLLFMVAGVAFLVLCFGYALACNDL
ncbi:protein of unknown function [Rhodovastum atsumiense]|nr:protein of unknown function [Rhodovastum atsumiense]